MPVGRLKTEFVCGDLPCKRRRAHLPRKACHHISQSFFFFLTFRKTAAFINSFNSCTPEIAFYILGALYNVVTTLNVAHVKHWNNVPKGNGGIPTFGIPIRDIVPHVNYYQLK
jgi:hypothetical protein